jgi:hypothetical protein
MWKVALGIRWLACGLEMLGDGYERLNEKHQDWLSGHNSQN